MSIVALLTDFGTRDHYVGTMKGVVLSVCPEAALVDLTHDVPPQQIAAAAWELQAAWRYFPAATVFLAVVDPGVGTARRALAAEAGGYFFVGPDNGIFTAVFDEVPPSAIVELREKKFARSTVSRTFEGRDRFAPAAGWLARGTPLSALGPPVSDYVRLPIPVARATPDGLEGEVVRVDRFGNLITNISRTHLEALAGNGTEVVIGGHHIAGVVATYGDAAPGAVCALLGSSDHLEVAIRGGDAATELGLGRGTPVHVRCRSRSG